MVVCCEMEHTLRMVWEKQGKALWVPAVRSCCFIVVITDIVVIIIFVVVRTTVKLK